jgi:hypothetical protein
MTLARAAARASADGKTEAVQVEVISEPSGARIEVNNDYVGDAPLTIALAGNKRGVVRDYRIVATPTISGQYVQNKLLLHRSDGPSDPVPRKLFFDMRLVPKKDVEVDVHLHNDRD